jgi:hypothetical protein
MPPAGGTVVTTSLGSAGLRLTISAETALTGPARYFETWITSASNTSSVPIVSTTHQRDVDSFTRFPL